MNEPTDAEVKPNWSPPSPSPYTPPPQLQAPPRKEPGGFKRGFGTGFGGGIGLGLALGIFGFITMLVSLMALGSMLAAAGGLASTKSASERLSVIWGVPNADQIHTIRAIEIKGTIQASGGDGSLLSAGTYGYEVAAILDSLQAEDAAGVVLLINTPGGTINGSRAIGEAVERYQKRTGKKVFAYVEGMSASGGMYAMAGADKIIADHGSLIGSIGVIFGPFERYKDVTAKGGTLLTPGVTTTGGITQEYLSQGKGKDFGNPFRDMTPEERERLMKSLTIEYNEFVNWVAEHRKLSPDKIKNELGAYIFGGKDAIANGLIDAQMGREEAFSYIAKAMGLEPTTARIVVPAKPTLFETLLGAEQRIFGQSAPPPAGKPLTATSVLCSATPGVLAVHGSLKQWCG